MRDDRYRPADVAEVEQKVSLLNEPIREEVIELRPGQSAASLHALLVGVRNQAQALLDRLETRGVYVPKDQQREVVRLLYVATRNQEAALEATLELEGLEEGARAWWLPGSRPSLAFQLIKEQLPSR